MRALIIEDDDSQAGVVRGALTGMGYTCDVADDGEGGLRAKLSDPSEKCNLIENKRGFGYIVW